MLPTIFCPECQDYLGLVNFVCFCGWERPSSENLQYSGKPLWQTLLPGMPRASAVVVDDIVLFPWGRRGSQKGGVVALERETGKMVWDISTEYAVEGGISEEGDSIFFGTLGFLGGGAKLYCLRLDGGEEIWSRALSGGVWSSPVVSEARVYIGSDDGNVHCFAREDGRSVPHWPIHLEPGRMWVSLSEDNLIAVLENGSIIALDPLSGRPSWMKPVAIGDKIASPSLLVGNNMYFGSQDGNVYRLNLHRRKPHVLAKGYKGVVAKPAHADGVLYVGAKDHYLHALDIESGEEIWHSIEFEHSISSAPFVKDGLVVVCVNKVGVYLLEAENGDVVWHYPVEGSVQLFSNPILFDGVIYVGADDGAVYALPWHLGYYEWAANELIAKNEFSEAAKFYILQAHNCLDLKERGALYEKAADCWMRTGHPELAARLWEHLIEDERAALAYRQAGRVCIGRDHRQAAEYYSLASQMYWQLGDEDAKDECASKAQKLGQWPLLRIKPWTDPTMTQYEKGSITFRVENVGKMAAKNLTLNLGGSLTVPAFCWVHDPLPSGSYFDITLEIIPTKDDNDLVVQAEYVDVPSRQNPFSTTSRAVVKAEPPPDIVELSNVAAPRGIEINITNRENRRVHYKLDYVYASSITIGESKQDDTGEA